jgi:hypothetical protein
MNWDLTSRNLLSHSSEGWKFETKLSADWFLLKAMTEALLHASLKTSGGLQQSLAALLCLLPHSATPCVWVCLSLFFLVVLGFELRAFTLSHSSGPVL